MNFQVYDLGVLKRGATVVVTLTGNAANVRLMDKSNFGAYKAGRRHHYYGGLASRSPVRLAVPQGGHWYVTVDLQGLSGRVRSSVRVEASPLPTIRQPLTTPLSTIRDNAHPVHGDLSAGTAPGADLEWDVFISHASEDKDAVALPLASALTSRGLRVWLDVAEMRIGDSLRRKIDQGVSKSRFGVVILTRHFFAKQWPQYELDGLVTRQMTGEQVILPIWHEITKEEVIAVSPSLADKLARDTSQTPIENIADEIANVARG